MRIRSLQLKRKQHQPKRMTDDFDISYVVLLSSSALLLVAIGLLIHTIICYFIDLANLPKNKTIVNKVMLNDNLYACAPMYQLTVVLLRNNVVLNYTFEVDKQTYEAYNIGDIYKGGFLDA